MIENDIACTNFKCTARYGCGRYHRVPPKNGHSKEFKFKVNKATRSVVCEGMVKK